MLAVFPSVLKGANPSVKSRRDRIPDMEFSGVEPEMLWY